MKFIGNTFLTIVLWVMAYFITGTFFDVLSDTFWSEEILMVEPGMYRLIGHAVSFISASFLGTAYIFFEIVAHTLEEIQKDESEVRKKPEQKHV